MPSDIPDQRTLCFLLDNYRILLGLKMRGMGRMNYNGLGGMLQEGETPEIAAAREVLEEGGVIIKPENLKKMGVIDFDFPCKPEWNQTVHIYTACRWEGELKDTPEMKLKWFDKNK